MSCVISSLKTINAIFQVLPWPGRYYWPLPPVVALLHLPGTPLLASQRHCLGHIQVGPTYDFSESIPFDELIENRTHPYFRADTGCAVAPSEDIIDRMRMWPF